MQKISNKRGLAWGAALAVLLSSFFGVQPASASDAVNGEKLGLTPASGTTTNFNGLVTEDFAMKAFLLPGISNGDWGAPNVYWEVTRVSGNVDILVSNVAIAAFGTTSVSKVASTWTTASAIAGTMSGSVSNLVIAAATGSALAGSSASPTTVVTVKVWIDDSAGTDGEHDAFEWFTTKTVTLHSPSALAASTTITQPTAGDTVWTVSATVTSPVNFENLGGSWYLNYTASASVLDASGTAGTSRATSGLNGTTIALRSGVISESVAVSGSQSISGLVAGTSISAAVYYDANGDLTSAGDTYQIGATAYGAAGNPSVGSLEVDVVSGDHATQSGTTATVRANQAYTFRVGAISNSASVSNQAVSVKITGGPDLTLNVKHISINGGAATTSYPSTTAPLALTTNTSGYADFTVTPTGFVDGNDFTVTAYVGNNSKSLTVQVEASSYSLTADYSQFKSGAGETTTMTYQVKDQWGVHAPTSANLRLKMTKGGTGFSYTTTVSYVSVVDGRASFAFTPEAATKTGSATATAVMQELQPSSGAYLDISAGVAASVNVTATADAFGTGLATSYSTSVSYFPSTVSWVTVTAKAANTGSAVVASGTGLIFRSNGVTYSDTVTVRAASNLNYTFEVAALKSGTYTLNLTTGTAATSSLIIVGGPSHNSGSAIVFDVTNIVPGRTAIVTGTVQDVNGNGVDTTEGAGTASILVTYTGTAGIPVGTMPTETDADGNFKISILTSATDLGSFTLTAVYLKDGASTATADKVTKVHTITVGAAAEASADQKITVGTFKGYVAIYTKGYMGQKLSAKVAGKWLVVDPIAAWQGNDYSRTVRLTGAGYTIKVDLYIDGVFVRSETVVTK